MSATFIRGKSTKTGIIAPNKPKKFWSRIIINEKRLILMALLVLFGCGKPPYADLNKSSYGPLINYRDATTKLSITPPTCNPNIKYKDVNDLTTTAIGKIFEPVGGMTKIDQKILNEELQDKFRNPGDFTMPNVVILEDNAHRIVFWYMSDLVSLKEVANAAEAYCLKRKRQALYEGSSRQCGKPQQIPLKIGGQNITNVDTYAISSFQCAMPSSFSRTSASRGAE